MVPTSQLISHLDQAFPYGGDVLRVETHGSLEFLTVLYWGEDARSVQLRIEHEKKIKLWYVLKKAPLSTLYQRQVIRQVSTHRRLVRVAKENSKLLVDTTGNMPTLEYMQMQ